MTLLKQATNLITVLLNLIQVLFLFFSGSHALINIIQNIAQMSADVIFI